MSYKKFGNKDIFVNTMRTHPHCAFSIFDSKTIYNNIPFQTGTIKGSGMFWNRAGNVRDVATNDGNISLYEYNIDRAEVATGRAVETSSIADTNIIYPWISKDSARSSFQTVGQTSYNNEFQFGDILTSSYPFKASPTRRYIRTPSSSAGTYDARYVALRNRLEYYTTRSPLYAVSTSAGNKNSMTLNMISVPSIFYGTRINPGSISLRWYYTGSLVGELRDLNENGELIQVGPPGFNGSGSVAGVALYDEGILLLSGSWALASASLGITDAGAISEPRWIYFGAGCNDGVNQTTAGSSFQSASFYMSFDGSTDTQVMTMFAHAKRGEVNYSNNPTFTEFGQDKTFFTSSHIYEESKDTKLKNFVSSSHLDYSASFERQVFVSRVAVYDKNKNLIGVATLANPVLKKEAEDISFKLKLDI
tara:strand:- start:2308 stop:3567 length:1260 start_codon:yes stop_codon:yes gene_type:complete